MTDAHAHPLDLARRFPAAEEERRRVGAACAASAWSLEEFVFHEELARRARSGGAAPLKLCFAVHPQLPASAEWEREGGPSLAALHSLAGEGRLDAVGETGFDLYNSVFRETERTQEALFAEHLETALRYGLPLVLHVRRAMHRVFAHAGSLKKLPAAVFHSYSGTLGEAEALLRRGINAYFSFGAAILLNHKEAIRACAALPAERLLLETDAPYQPLRGRDFSSFGDLRLILAGAAALRGEAGGEAAQLEGMVDANFAAVFG